MKNRPYRFNVHCCKCNATLFTVWIDDPEVPFSVSAPIITCIGNGNHVVKQDSDDCGILVVEEIEFPAKHCTSAAASGVEQSSGSVSGGQKI